MPLSPISDRQFTVAYAIDLLRAHQIRRENVFLHEQFKICLKELATLREEVRTLKATKIAAAKDEINGLRAAVQINDSTIQKTLILAENHDVRLNEQGHELEVIQRSWKALQLGISDAKTASTKAQEIENARLTSLENQIGALRLDHQNFAAAQIRQAQHNQVTLESFQTALDEKADISAIEALEDQLAELRLRPPTAKITLPSISRISESVQVPDSQQQECRRETESPPEEADPLESRHGPRETVPEDLDLDANAETVSYTGHHQAVSKQNESMDMLTPSAAQATQLARVKTLQQRRNDDWTSYYDRGQKLLENLPSSFEETVVHNFVDGIFKEAHKRHCRQWLDTNGWNWTNVASFGDLCSQVLAGNTRNVAADSPVRLEPPRQMKDLIAAAGANQEKRQRKDNKQPQKTTARQTTTQEPPRRSQRIAEKQSQQSCLPRMSASSRLAVRLAKSVSPAASNRADDNTKGITKAADMARDRSKPTKQTQPRTVSKKPSPRPERTEISKGVARPNTAGVWPVMSETESSAGPATKKRKCKIAEPGSAAPRLVSAKQQTSKPAEESSDDEGFLYKLKPNKDSASASAEAFLSKRRPAKYHAYGAQRKREGKQQRLPLPPPPEIPILSTTDEE